MVQSLKRLARGAVSAFLIALVSIIWAAPLSGAAHLYERVAGETSGAGPQFTIGTASRTRQLERAAAAAGLPRVARFRESDGRGLIVSAWVNGVGVYSFAVDTGAGPPLISDRVARDARVSFQRGRATVMSGMSGAGPR